MKHTIKHLSPNLYGLVDEKGNLVYQGKFSECKNKMEELEHSVSADIAFWVVAGVAVCIMTYFFVYFLGA